MKKLMALIALVAMVAMSSLAYAQGTGTVPVSISVADELTLTMDTCGTTGLAITSGLTTNDEADTSCTFQITDNNTATSHDLYVSDDDDSTTEQASPVGSVPGTLDQIDGVATDGSDVAAGTAEVGYYIDNNGGADTIATCTSTAAVCAAIENVTTRPVNDQTGSYDTSHNWTLGMAVSTNIDQVSESYTDDWTLNLEVGS